MQIIKEKSESDVVKCLCKLIEKIANQSIADNGKFFVGLSGASLVKMLSSGLPEIKTVWSKWVIAFCDERLVPEDSTDSTYGAYVRDLLPTVPITRDQFVTIEQGVSCAEAAKDYTRKLRSVQSDIVFDLLVLGMGPDGHTCSLFPGHQLLDSEDPVAFITDSPKPPPQRITLTYSVINKARNCVFALMGNGKADVVKRILHDKEDYPAGRVKPASGNLYWLLDEAAASLLP